MVVLASCLLFACKSKAGSDEASGKGASGKPNPGASVHSDARAARPVTLSPSLKLSPGVVSAGELHKFARGVSIRIAITERKSVSDRAGGTRWRAKYEIELTSPKGTRRLHYSWNDSMPWLFETRHLGLIWSIQRGPRARTFKVVALHPSSVLDSDGKPKVDVKTVLTELGEREGCTFVPKLEELAEVKSRSWPGKYEFRSAGSPAREPRGVIQREFPGCVISLGKYTGAHVVVRGQQ
jgi:hypothetical protein